MGLVSLYQLINMIGQDNRLIIFQKMHDDAILMAIHTHMLPRIELSDINYAIPMLKSLLSIEHQISHQVMVQLWDYYSKQKNPYFTDGRQTRMIVKSVAFAGMFAAYEYQRNAGEINKDDIISHLASPDMGKIIINVQNSLRMDATEGLFLQSRTECISEKVFNTLFEKYQVRGIHGLDVNAQGMVFYDTMSIMFELGATYAIFRMEGCIERITEAMAWEKITL